MALKLLPNLNCEQAWWWFLEGHIELPAPPANARINECRNKVLQARIGGMVVAFEGETRFFKPELVAWWLLLRAKQGSSSQNWWLFEGENALPTPPAIARIYQLHRWPSSF
jgi:hypothetical protein